MPISEPSPSVPQGIYSIQIRQRDAEALPLYLGVSVHIEDPDGNILDPANEAIFDATVQRLVDELQGLTDFEVIRAAKEFAPTRAMITPTPPAEQ